MLTKNNLYLTWNILLFEIFLVLHDVSDVNEGVGHVLTVSILVVFWGFTYQREPDPERSYTCRLSLKVKGNAESML